MSLNKEQTTNINKLINEQKLLRKSRLDSNSVSNIDGLLWTKVLPGSPSLTFSILYVLTLVVGLQYRDLESLGTKYMQVELTGTCILLIFTDWMPGYTMVDILG